MLLSQKNVSKMLDLNLGNYFPARFRPQQLFPGKQISHPITHHPSKKNVSKIFFPARFQPQQLFPGERPATKRNHQKNECYVHAINHLLIQADTRLSATDAF